MHRSKAPSTLFSAKIKTKATAPMADDVSLPNNETTEKTKTTEDIIDQQEITNSAARIRIVMQRFITTLHVLKLLQFT